jgi:crotonobetainyl-CoA:carnitine CoA-transferase CaiB-like acyl-CoA transferase
LISARLAEETTCSWLKALDETAVPAGPINSVDVVVADPQMKARDLTVDFFGYAAPVRVIGNPIRFSRTPIKYDGGPPPKLGQHTQDILSGLLEVNRDEIAVLQRDGVI